MPQHEIEVSYMKCNTCGNEMIVIYKGVWINDRTQIQPEFVCQNGCGQPKLLFRDEDATKYTEQKYTEPKNDPITPP